MTKNTVSLSQIQHFGLRQIQLSGLRQIQLSGLRHIARPTLKIHNNEWMNEY